MIAGFIAGALISGTVMTQDQRSPIVDKWMGTRWSADALEGRGWTEYPRPQLVRSDWLNLNGRWEYAISDKATPSWPGPEGAILVPYPVQSKLSGVQRQVYEDQALWYRSRFTRPADWSDQRTTLNFGAVDWEATVWINGSQVGQHRGGYDPFSFDITEFLKEGENEIVVRAWDPTDTGTQPHGKQFFNPNSIWYTAVTGIWQTVWIEPVAENSLVSVVPVTKIDGSVEFQTEVDGSGSGLSVEVDVLWKGESVAEGRGGANESLTVKVPNARLWSPDSPNLYDAEVRLMRDGVVVDRIQTYFGIREIELKTDEFGPRVYLNGEPVFMFGPLDQGWWPDGLYTPPTDDALRYDLEVTKRAGFNTVRKHVKVEPATFFRHCDELGLLVWQDMPSNLKFPPGWDMDFRKENPKADGPRPQESKDQFLVEWGNIMDACKPFTSVVVWVPFNEAWGQFDTKRISEWTKANDPSRLVNSASGGNFVNTGDIQDIHAYPGPATPDRLTDRAIVLGEFGGLGLPVKGHLWQDRDNWGYRTYDSVEVLKVQYEQLIKQLVLLKGSGLSGAIYTQTTDVEGEVNGLMTYDRAVVKMPLDWLNRVNRQVYRSPVTIQSLAETAEDEQVEWRYTTSAPGSNWFATDFSDSAWSTGRGGFGTEGTPGARIGTTWSSDDIWIRRSFDLADVSGDLYLKIHHDEEATVYLNGVLLTKLDGYTTGYVYWGLPEGVLKPGRNVIAIHCNQTQGGQYIDAGISRIVDK